MWDLNKYFQDMPKSLLCIEYHLVEINIKFEQVESYEIEIREMR